MLKHSTTYIRHLLLALTALGFFQARAVAQVVTGSGLEVSISSGTQVSWQGDWTNNGVITNQGGLSLTGNWQNNGVYLGNGKLVLNGTTLQIVDNNGLPIDSLVIDGGGEKQLQGDLTVLKSLVFVDGLLTPDQAGNLTTAEGATVGGASAASYVNGIMYRSGTGDLLFPIGNAANYLPVEVLSVSGANPVFAFEVVEPNTGAQPGAGLDTVSGTRYWQRLQQSGTYTGGIVRLPVVNETSVTDFNRVVVTEAGPTGNTFSLLGQSAATGNAINGTVTATAPFTGTRLAVGMSLTSANSADSVALVALYDSTDGNNWTNTLNGTQPWKVGPVETWFGVTVLNGRVTSVSLPGNGLNGTLPPTMKNLTMLQTLALDGNNLTGTIPAEWVNLVSLSSLNLAQNNLTALADLTAGVFLSTLNVAGNALLFEHLLPYTGVANFNFGGQDSIVNEPHDRIIQSGASSQFNALTSAAGNQYQWFKDDVAIGGATSQSFTITNAGRPSFGSYYAQVTNSSLPGLTLTTKRYNIKVKANVGGIAVNPESLPLRAGLASLYRITSSGQYDTIDMRAITADGRFLFPDVILDDYIIAFEASPTEHPDILLTYYPNVISWVNADTIFLNDNIDTLTLTGQRFPPPTNGTNVVTGLVEEEFDEEGGRVKARRRLRRTGIALRRSRISNRLADDDDFELVAFLYSDELGAFSFSSLEDGLYRINVEIPDLFMDTNSFLEFRLGGGQGAFGEINLRAVVEADIIRVIDETIVGIDDQQLGAVQLYPNPANRQVQVAVDGNLTNEYEVSIVDMYGKEVYNSAQQPIIDRGNAYLVDVGNLKGGLYLVNVYRKDPARRNIRVARLLIRR